MEEYRKDELSFHASQDVKSLLGVRVLSRNQDVVGKVETVHLTPDAYAFAGITVVRGPMRKKVYISREYIDHISETAFRLNMVPSYVQLGKRIITSDGKVLGRVLRVERSKERDTITHFIMRRRLFWKVAIPRKDVKRIGASIILQQNYEQAKTEFFQ